MSLIATLAAGISQQPGYGGATWMQGVLAAEITTMVTSQQITADHAVSMLATLAATSSFQLDALGVELNALIAANAIPIGQVINDLMQSALNADQVVTALVSMCTVNSTFDSPVYVQITAMIDSGAISAAQAMADIGRAPSDVALRLLTPFAGASSAIEDAAAAELATLYAQASGPSWIPTFYSYARAHWDAVHAIGWVVSVAAHGDAALQDFVDRQLRSDRDPSTIATCLTTFVATAAPSVLIQYYIGLELGRLIDHTTNAPPDVVVQNIITPVERPSPGRTLAPT